MKNRERVYFEQQNLDLLLVDKIHALSRITFAHISLLRGFVYLVKQSQSLPHEAFHVATKPTLNFFLLKFRKVIERFRFSGDLDRFRAQSKLPRAEIALPGGVDQIPCIRVGSCLLLVCPKIE